MCPEVSGFLACSALELFRTKSWLGTSSIKDGCFFLGGLFNEFEAPLLVGEEKLAPTPMPWS